MAETIQAKITTAFDSIKNNTSAGDHPIEVKVYDTTGTGAEATESLTYHVYCDDIQTALNAFYEVPDFSATIEKDDSKTDAENKTAAQNTIYGSNRRMEINLLRDMDGNAFQPGGTYNDGSGLAAVTDSSIANDSLAVSEISSNTPYVGRFKDYHITLNLGGHTYGFTQGLSSGSAETKKGTQILRNRLDSTSYFNITNGTLKVADKTDTDVERHDS